MIHSNICCDRLSGGEPLLKIWNEQRNCKTEANLSDLELVIQLWRAARSSDDATVATASQAHRACRWFEIAGEPCAVDRQCLSKIDHSRRYHLRYHRVF